MDASQKSQLLMDMHLSKQAVAAAVAASLWGSAPLRLGDLDHAVEAFAMALASSKDVVAASLWASVLLQLGDLNCAVEA